MIRRTVTERGNDYKGEARLTDPASKSERIGRNSVGVAVMNEEVADA